MGAEGHRESGEVFDERRDHSFGYVPLDVRKGADYSEPLGEIGGTLSEDYAEGRRSLHAHFRVGSEGDIEFRDYCAIFKRFCGDFGCIEGACVCRDKGNLVRCGYRQMRQPVLVAVRKLSKPPEAAGGYRHVPSVVRLQPLNECPSFGMDAPDHGLTLLVKPVLGSEDGELGVVGDALGHLGPLVGEREFVGEVVKGASEVVEAVPDDRGERDGRGLEDFGADELIAALEVRLGPHTTRISLAPDSLLRLYALQVFGCAV